MDLRTFERRALARWQQIPARFREGVSALVIDPGTYRKEEFEEGWCYGYCEPDEAIMAIPDAPVTSRITLFYGSFVHIAALEDDFDWEAELAETLRHELQHHMEWRAGEDDLGDEDDLQDENERRCTGLPFTPGYHRLGVQLGRGVWLGDDTLFVEVDVPKRDWPLLGTEGWSVTWGGLEATVPPVPADVLGDDVLYAPADVVVFDEDEADALWPWEEVVVVLRRKRGWWPW
ncbi:MAG: metallopeptidase family protein [Alphaproteobacteria bacterium]|nr:metallopeptidase family protein [Alphaproteobacteria bacterium]